MPSPCPLSSQDGPPEEDVSFQGFSQVLNELKRPLVIQFLVDLIPYLRDHVACRTLRLGDPPFLGNYFLAGLSRTGDRVDHKRNNPLLTEFWAHLSYDDELPSHLDQRLAGFEIPPLGSLWSFTTTVYTLPLPQRAFYHLFSLLPVQNLKTF
ncbi:hypothetical protein B0H13DRAFT_1928804, partial [Mycena leptocephala]